MRKNAAQINFHNLPVYNFSDFNIQNNAGIILAFGSKYHKEILPELKKRNLLNQCFIQSQIIFSDENVDRNMSSLLKESSYETDSYFKNFNELDSIGKSTKTDKCSVYHNYLDKYEFFLRKFKNENIKLLELGVYEGSSIKMWEEYFPKSDIIGVDINPDCQKFNNERTKIITADLSNIDDIDKLKDIRPNIILDDASHLWSHQLKALFTLFPSLIPGGVYILEDLCTSFRSYKNTGYDDAAISAYDVLSAINEVVTGREILNLENKHYVISKISNEIENLAMQIEMMAFIHESVIIIKR